MINVFLVDDHELVRTGIQRLLEEVRGIKVIGTAKDGEDAVSWCRKNQADVILMDMNMPGIGGLEATKKILRLQPDAKIIVLTVHSDPLFPTKVMQAGAFGYLTKGSAPEEMIRAVRQVVSGQRYLPADIAQQMALNQLMPKGKDSNPFEALSERELQITLLITQGERVTEISDRLNLSPKTINTYRYRLFEKLGIHGDVELTRLAIRHGVIDSQTF